jgi:hypothetical protein
MATQADVRRLAMALPGVTEKRDDFAFGIEVKGKPKGFAWSWKQRIDPKRPRVPNLGVLAVRVRDEIEKVTLLGGDSDIFFTEPHYDGFPAVLVRLAAIDVPRLRAVLANAHACMTATRNKRTRRAASNPKRPSKRGAKPSRNKR